ncbi:MAG TPA: TldD/PmbA family protein, partial [bacterium]|nr:TldD/PmbA family protein [bacterium]
MATTIDRIAALESQAPGGEPRIEPYLGEGLDYLRQQGVDYGDLRQMVTTRQTLQIKNREVESFDESVDAGFGVRVLVDGAWGFAASATRDADSARRAVDQAIQVARASAMTLRHRATLSEEPVHRAHFASPVIEDPFLVPLDEKLQYLFGLQDLLPGDPRITAARTNFSAHRFEKQFVSTEGAAISQNITGCGAGIEVITAKDGEFQRRSFPASFGGDLANRGYEHVRVLRLHEHCERVRREALELLEAPKMPAGKHDLVLMPNQMMLQVHESVGHPVELDRVYGDEISLAGGSFAQPHLLNHFQYASPLVSIVLDGTIPGGLGCYGFDDEGVQTCKEDIIRDGIFVGYLKSRETAAKLGPGHHA